MLQYYASELPLSNDLVGIHGWCGRGPRCCYCPVNYATANYANVAHANPKKKILKK